MAKKTVPGQITEKELAALPEYTRKAILSAMELGESKKETKSSVGASLAPSLAPIAQSLGKLQQISDPKVVEGVAPVRSVDSSISRDIKQTSDSLKTLVTLNRTLNSSIEKVNKTLVDQLDYSKLVERRQSKQDEENNELFRRLLGGDVSTDREATRASGSAQQPMSRVSPSKTQGASGPGFNIDLPKVVPTPIPSGTKPGGVGGAAAKTAAAAGTLFRTAVGALVRGGMGGLGAAATYGLLPQEMRDKLNQYGVDEERATVYGAAIGLATKNPYAALLAALGVGIYEADRAFTNLPKEKQEEVKKQVGELNVPGAMNPDAAFVDAIRLGGRTEEQYEAERLSDIRDRTASRREEGALTTMFAPVPRNMLNNNIQPSVQRPDEAAAATVTVVTPDTPDIPENKAVEILGPALTGGSQALNWKNMSKEDRSKRLRLAQRKGVDLTIRPSAPEIAPSTTPSLSNRLGMFNLATSEEARNAGVPQPPTIIRGGDTINNVNNVGGGSGGGSSGSPSLLYNPWEEQQIGRRWAPYPSGWR